MGEICRPELQKKRGKRVFFLYFYFIDCDIEMLFFFLFCSCTEGCRHFGWPLREFTNFFDGIERHAMHFQTKDTLYTQKSKYFWIRGNFLTYCQFSECFVIRKLTLTKNSSSSNHHLRRNSSYFQKNFPQHFFGLLLSRMTILFSFREKFSPSSLFFNYSVLYSIFNEASLNICVQIHFGQDHLLKVSGTFSCKYFSSNCNAMKDTVRLLYVFYRLPFHISTGIFC